MIFIYFKIFSTLVIATTILVLVIFDLLRRWYGGRDKFRSVLSRKSILYKRTSEANLSVSGVMVFRCKRLFFVKLGRASLDANNILFFNDKERLVFLFWLLVVTSVSWVYLVFIIFWSTYWLALIIRGRYIGARAIPNTGEAHLTPAWFRSVRYEREEVDTDFGVDYILHPQCNGLLAHVLEVLLWLVVKVPYYRSFCIVSKISVFYEPKEKSSQLFYAKIFLFCKKLLLFIKNFLFRQIFSVPILFVRFALKASAGYRESPMDPNRKVLSLKTYLYKYVLNASIVDPELARLRSALAILYPSHKSGSWIKMPIIR